MGAATLIFAVMYLNHSFEQTVGKGRLTQDLLSGFFAGLLASLLRLLLTILILLVTIFELDAQDQPYVHHTERLQDSGKTESVKSMQDFLRNGQFFGHSRYFFMVTDNADGLTDYFANAVGFGIGYETGKFKGFQLGISGYAIYHLGSSDLSNVDALSNQPNRYELGLFDVADPKNLTELDRLEDLYVKYSGSKYQMKIGKQHIKTPFINPQDGRMRPTLVRGVLANYRVSPKWMVQVGGIDQISPRSTVHWHRVSESLGLYGVGVNPDGTKSLYKGNVVDSYVGFLGLEGGSESVKWKFWDQVMPGVFNTTLVQFDGARALNGRNRVNAQSNSSDLRGLKQVEANQTGKSSRPELQLDYGVQWITQQSMGYGGNEDQSKTYFGEKNRSVVFGMRAGVSQPKRWKLGGNYTRITAHGRYLMPREWGRDPFFTFMPRERNEGYGDVHAFTLVYSKQVQRVRGLSVDLSYGRFYLPDVKNYAMNKYGFPAYQQGNVDVRYRFAGFLSGLDLQFLMVVKNALGSTYDLPKYEINKVNLTHLNLILNYHF